MSKQKYWTPGNYVVIPLVNGRHCYGVVTITEQLALMDYCDTETLTPKQIASLNILFEVTVMTYGIGKNGWPLSGQIELNDKFLTKPYFYKKDPINGKYSIVDHNWMNEVPATKDECAKLEEAAAYEPGHITDRLSEYYKLQ